MVIGVMNQVSYLRGTTLYPPSPMNITSAKALGGGSQLTQLTQLSGSSSAEFCGLVTLKCTTSIQHQLIDGKHPIIYFGLQPSGW